MSTPAPPPPSNGKIVGLINAVRGLTPMHALTLFLVSLTIVPGFLIYKLASDPPLLDRVLSGYRELPSANPSCVVRNAFIRGGPDVWGIASSFAAQGSDRYFLSVQLNHEPTPEDIASYCATLLLLVDFMRDPARASPNFPGTSTPLVEPYANGGTRDAP